MKKIKNLFRNVPKNELYALVISSILVEVVTIVVNTAFGV